MYQVRQVKTGRLFSVIAEMLANGQRTRITVTGMSMYPFLRGNIDSVELCRTSIGKVSRGDIVLIRRTGGQYILHRLLCKEKGCLYIVGDSQTWVEGPLNPDQLIAVVTAVWRKDKRIDCSRLPWKFLSRLWLDLLPVRSCIIKVYGCLHKMCKNVSWLLSCHSVEKSDKL